MATKVGAENSLTYEEFEPFCKWQREEARDTLIVHLPGNTIGHKKIALLLTKDYHFFQIMHANYY